MGVDNYYISKFTAMSTDPIDVLQLVNAASQINDYNLRMTNNTIEFVLPHMQSIGFYSKSEPLTLCINNMTTFVVKQNYYSSIQFCVNQFRTFDIMNDKYKIKNYMSIKN